MRQLGIDADAINLSGLNNRVLHRLPSGYLWPSR